MTDETEQLQAELDAARARIDERDRDCEVHQDIIGGLTKELNEARKQVAAWKCNDTILEERIAEADVQIDGLVAESAALAATVARLTSELQARIAACEMPGCGLTCTTQGCGIAEALAEQPSPSEAERAAAERAVIDAAERVITESVPPIPSEVLMDGTARMYSRARVDGTAWLALKSALDTARSATDAAGES